MPAPTIQTGNSSKTVADILVAQGKLSSDKAEKVKLEFINSGKPIEKTILEEGLVSESDLTAARAQFYNIPFILLGETPSSPDALNLIPKAVAEANTLLPFAFDKKKNELSLAMADPLNLEVVEFVEKKTGTRVKPFMAPIGEIKNAILERYGAGLATEVTAALREAAPEMEVKTIDIRKLGEVIREAPIAKIVSTLLEFAIRSRASDIHLEPQEDKTRVRYRVDGILHEKLVLPKNFHEALVSRIKILSGMKIDEKRVPQDGRFNFRVDSEEVDLRVSTLPTVHGEKIVMRLLKKTGGIPNLPELGLRGKALANLEDAILRPHGIIIVCGPTGSGKTTTLYAVLSKINTTRVNIVTLEDPVEYQIPGVNQVQVNPAAGLTFASGLRSFLRQDPNIILVGEIRDTETADLAIQASLTGHLVFSTLHTNSAAGSLPRLLDMHAEPFLLASSMTAVAGQRICRRVCPTCKEEYEPAPEVLEDIKNVLGSLLDKSIGEKLKLFRGKGCPECNNTGYFGRIGIFEVLPVTEKIGRLILERAPASAIEKQAVLEGMITMKQDGYLKAVEGIVTIEEVLRVAQD
ncbi:MAG: GspE/PulE family protein [Patescibacteria group bacterium]